MYRRQLAPSVHGPPRLRVLPVHAGRSFGVSPVYSARPGSSRDRPASRRGSQGRDDPRGDRARRERNEGGWGSERGNERRDSQWRGGDDDGYGSGSSTGGGGGSSGRRWERDTAKTDQRRPFAGVAKRGTSGRVSQRQQQQQQQQGRPRLEREGYGNDEEAGGEYDGEYDEAMDDVDEAGSRRGDGGSGGPCLRDTLQGEALYGVFPVLAALRAKRRKVHRAFLLASMDLSKRKDAGLVRQVEAMCAEAGVEVVRTVRHELNLMSHDRPHQGLVLDVSPLEWTFLDEFPPAEEVMEAAAQAAAGPPVWLALDEVVDPQNLGAVVRSAYCLGAAGVLACSRNCAPLSAVVSKASAGALEALPLHSCRNMPRTLMDARDRRGWAVLGAAAGSGSEPVGRVRVDRPTILVLGSEGFGLRTNVRRACSGLVRVDMAPAATARTAGGGGGSGGSYDADAAAAGAHRPQQQQAPQQAAVLRGLVESLNVSVATGILLHSLMNSAAAAATAGPAAGDPTAA